MKALHIQNKVHDISVITLQENKFAEAIRNCTVYNMFNPSSNKVTYYYGGGSFDISSGIFTLWIDYLRPNFSTSFNVKDILFFEYDTVSFDIFFADGTLISSNVSQKIRSDRCNFGLAKFDDMRLVTMHDKVAVVNLQIMDVSAAEINKSIKFLSGDLNSTLCLDPLTIAYEKQKDGVYIGLWNVVKGGFVSRKQKYGRRLLDIRF